MGGIAAAVLGCLWGFGRGLCTVQDALDFNPPSLHVIATLPAGIPASSPCYGIHEQDTYIFLNRDPDYNFYGGYNIYGGYTYTLPYGSSSSNWGDDNTPQNDANGDPSSLGGDGADTPGGGGFGGENDSTGEQGDGGWNSQGSGGKSSEGDGGWGASGSFGSGTAGSDDGGSGGSSDGGSSGGGSDRRRGMDDTRDEKPRAVDLRMFYYNATNGSSTNGTDVVVLDRGTQFVCYYSDAGFKYFGRLSNYTLHPNGCIVHSTAPPRLTKKIITAVFGFFAIVLGLLLTCYMTSLLLTEDHCLDSRGDCRFCCTKAKGQTKSRFRPKKKGTVNVGRKSAAWKKKKTQDEEAGSDSQYTGGAGSDSRFEGSTKKSAQDKGRGSDSGFQASTLAGSAGNEAYEGSDSKGTETTAPVSGSSDKGSSS